MHSTSNLEDNYMGSGKRLKRSLNKYGAENHTKEILEFLTDRKSLAEREREIVNQEILNEELCMNLQLGGGGGISSEEHLLNLHNGSSKWNHDKWKNEVWIEKNYKNISESSSIRAKKTWSNPENADKLKKAWNWKGRNHSKETIEQMKNSHKGQGIGESNSQYGTCWITNNSTLEKKKIKKTELEIYINDGWRTGRK